MRQITDSDLCVGCSACKSVCPVNAIEMEPDKEGFYRPKINDSSCIECGKCERRCPANVKPETVGSADYLACRAKDSQLLRRSTSGGLFGLLAERVLELDGVIYGASFIKPDLVNHIRVTSYDELKLLHGAKYVQSLIGDSFVKAKEDLDAGRYVLFSGTPCQIAGLKCFLNNEYEKLLSVSVVCHGVPSPKVLRTYIGELEKRNNRVITALSFRNKDKGWNNYKVKILFDGNKKILSSARKNEYMRGFVQNLFSRRSCGNCMFRLDHSQSDIILGDYWGIQAVRPEFDNSDCGVSAVIITTKRGRSFIDDIRAHCDIIETTKSEMTRFNGSIVKSSPIHPMRDYFFSNLGTTPFDDLVVECIGKIKRKDLTESIKSYIYKIYGRIRRFK